MKVNYKTRHMLQIRTVDTTQTSINPLQFTKYGMALIQLDKHSLIQGCIKPRTLCYFVKPSSYENASDGSY